MARSANSHRAKRFSNLSFLSLSELSLKYLNLFRLSLWNAAGPTAGRTVLSDETSVVVGRGSGLLSLRTDAAILFICTLPALLLAGRFYSSAPGRASIRLQVEKELVAGGLYVPNLVVRDSVTHKPLEGVRLVASMGASDRKNLSVGNVGEATTDSNGMISSVEWKIPDGLQGDNLTLYIDAKDEKNRELDSVEQPVKWIRNDCLALAPDRTLARPGETIRARTLLVSSGLHKPIAAQQVTIDLIDPNGNRIGRAKKKSSAFGLAWAEFALNSAAPEGAYQLKAEAGGLKSERTVNVTQYRMPPFNVSLTPDRGWFSRRDRLTGKISARTFDGHAVNGCKGSLKLLNAERRVLQTAEITLNEKGAGDFDLEALGAAGPDAQNVRTLTVWVDLTDAVGRGAGGQTPLYVGDSPLDLNAIAESGELVPGVKNTVYILVREPNGTPVTGRLRVQRDGWAGKNEAADIETDEHGVASFAIENARTPAEVLEIFSDIKGAGAQRVTIPVRSAERGSLLVRTDKALLSAGDSLKVTVLHGAVNVRRWHATIAITQEGRTVALGRVPLNAGRGEATLKIPRGVSGTLTVEASLALLDGRVWTDSRAIGISGGGNVRVAASVDRAAYRPGERARVSFAVTDAAGSGIPAAVSVVAVDDALLALTGDHPGLAQALQAAGINTLGPPRFPLSPARFSPANGSSDAAVAAFAAAPKPAKTEATVIDTAFRKIAQAQAEKRATGKQLESAITFILITVLVLELCRVARPRGAAARALSPWEYAIGVAILLLGVILPTFLTTQRNQKMEMKSVMPGNLPLPADRFQTVPLAESADATPKSRWDFPETLLFAPEVITDEKGRATLDVPLANSLTSWQVQVDAIAASGGTAWTAQKLVVTQP